MSCASKDSSTNNTALIAGLILGSLLLIVFLLFVGVIRRYILTIKNKKKVKRRTSEMYVELSFIQVAYCV